MNVEFDWTPESVATLRRLWAEGHSVAEIGRRMGISKNAVASKVHRLELPGRPSPIRRGMPAGTSAAANLPPPPSEREREGNAPLPAFHPISWGALTTTVLVAQ